ncbi:Mut7-C RNAse domain-containing protein [Stigmatella sp. ncwal1]|uniref:Mut7-C RNAse domain-containing protein n=1 Tax=Stigmatella ashevillensis TaxID=2995309 RepID=A0ABT5DCP9_9BACT|nr:Mut7-C RNAse domain-containing protein [Stigmatella ashevillena]MDC0711449.1 Mut7-C RNAse domain-containing protein [Stigmatella ashevillena]
MMPKQVTVRLYGALNDFLPPERRGTEFIHRFTGTPSVKDLLESLGPPHPEVDLILLDGQAVDFTHRVEAGSRVAAYPAFHALEVTALLRVGRPLPDVRRFALDVGLGRLAGFLRMLGFDTLWRNDFEDRELARLSQEDARLLLTRDLGLLKRAEVLHGYFPRHTDPAHQLVEVVRRFQLAARMQPFTRCMACNGLLVAVGRDDVLGRIPPGVAALHTHFLQCPSCQRVYWPGTHHQRMQALVDKLRALPAKTT